MRAERGSRASRRVPVATYRLQLNSRLRLEDARRLVPYLDRLGISHIYCSPILAACRGSDHGYDVTDPSRIRPDIGTLAHMTALVSALRRRGMGTVIDIVPNHMAASVENPWWRDVLEKGRASRFAGYFDIDWEPANRPWLKDRVLLPVLGAPLEEELREGKLGVGLGPEGLIVRYHDRVLPLAPHTYGHILSMWLDDWRTGLGTDHPAVVELRRLIRLSGRLRTARGRTAQRPAEVETIVRRLEKGLTSLRRRAGIERLMETGLDRMSPEDLHRLLQRQHYALADWRRASSAINYRRFFNIADLVCLRAESPEVFRASHDTLMRLLRVEGVAGLRVDHVDGLADPGGYLRRLRRQAGPGAFLVVEKILIGEETLPDGWPVHGTTGYDFLGLANGLFIDAKGWARLGRIYADFTGSRERFGAVANRSRVRIMESDFSGEVDALVARLSSLAGRLRRGMEPAEKDLRAALIETTASLGVYRTYIRDGTTPPRDRRVIESALREARARRKEIPAAAFGTLRDVLLPRRASRRRGLGRSRLDFVTRWQKLTGPVMAKGVEDTALYAYNRLLSVNEVGGDPGDPVTPLVIFHERLRDRHRRWPGTMNATATHDTKRGEDVRARLDALSWMADAWERRIGRWHRWNATHRATLRGRPVPDGDEELLIYQTLLGAWPVRRGEIPEFRGRLRRFLVKAVREAKRHSSWTDPDVAYEKGVLGFADRILRAPPNRFLEDFHVFQPIVARAGAVNSLSQVLLKLTAPGVPDVYQGCELWDLSLVDPDNRRPVDFDRRDAVLASLERGASRDRAGLARRLLRGWKDGRIKMYVTWATLIFRRERPALFGDGAYLPVLAKGGPRAYRVCAFARRHRGLWALTIVPRGGIAPRRGGDLPGAARDAGALVLPRGAPRTWTSVLTGETIAGVSERGVTRLPVGSALSGLPVGLLRAGERA